MQITLEYWNSLAQQLVLINTLLSGFSIAIVANLIVSDREDKLTVNILKVATISAGCFLVSLFSMSQISMITTPGGYLQNVNENDFFMPRMIGIVSFMFGLFSLTVMIALSGWTKSRSTGRFTTLVSAIMFILIMMTMVKVGF